MWDPTGLSHWAYSVHLYLLPLGYSQFHHRLHVSFNAENHNNLDHSPCCLAAMNDRVASNLLQLKTESEERLLVQII